MIKTLLTETQSD